MDSDLEFSQIENHHVTVQDLSGHELIFTHVQGVAPKEYGDLDVSLSFDQEGQWISIKLCERIPPAHFPAQHQRVHLMQIIFCNGAGYVTQSFFTPDHPAEETDLILTKGMRWANLWTVAEDEILAIPLDAFQF